jgi:Fe-S-cluster containining protein
MNFKKFEMKELCESCNHMSCCTGFDAPFLFENDIKKLKNIGKASNKFIEDIQVAELSVKSLKKKKNSTNCILWDEETNKCTIYEQRPFDCRMFPFDIMKIDGEYRWIVFSCNPDSNWKWTEEYLDKLEQDPAFSEIIENIETFHHTLETEFSEEHPLPYIILRKIKQTVESLKF